MLQCRWRLDERERPRYAWAVLFRRWIGPFFLLSVAFVGCEPSGAEVRDRTVQVGCGACRFHLEGHEGCYWAADFDGKVVPVSGDALPRDHEDHAPDGMCNVTRDAIVSGRLHDTHFVATRFDLQPVEPAAHPEHSHEH